ncbi:MAG TPA: response regulator transcription factor [Spirochaetia bacterium]|nr:response regulator transcription factor [Spirochaetia bacterium]
MKLKVLLVEDHTLVREGIESLLAADPEMKIVGRTGTGRGAVAMARQTAPDLVIMDVVMPDMNGIETTRQIVRENGAVKILVLSMYDNRDYISRMIEAGASGYVLKTSAFDELSKAIRVVMEGEVYLCSSITSVIVKDYLAKLRIGSSLPAEPPVLSAREREVLRMVSEGRSGKEIALELGVTPKTVESHRLHIMSKLKIRSVAGLTRYALREGLTSLDS